MKIFNRFLFSSVAGIMLATGAYAATDKDDLAVGVKTLPLLVKKIEGSADVAIVFNPSDATSKSEADGIKSAFDAGIAAPGGVKLTGVLVPVSDLGKIASTKIVVLTGGLKANFDAIASAVSGAGALSLSTDMDCVKSDKCILGVVSKPSVEIYYSEKAAEAAKVSFTPAFTMLVKKI